MVLRGIGNMKIYGKWDYFGWGLRSKCGGLATRALAFELYGLAALPSVVKSDNQVMVFDSRAKARLARQHLKDSGRGEYQVVRISAEIIALAHGGNKK